MQILSPATYGSLREAISYSHTASTPVAIRYPNSTESAEVVEAFYKDGNYSNLGIRCDFDDDNVPQHIFIAYGNTVELALGAKALLRSRGVEDVGVILVEQIKPYADPVSRIAQLISRARQVVYVEEGIKNGGAAMITRSMLEDMGFDFDKTKFSVCAIDDDFVIPDTVTDMYTHAGISPSCLADAMSGSERKI